MFTGIVEGIGTVKAVRSAAAGAVISVDLAQLAQRPGGLAVWVVSDFRLKSGAFAGLPEHTIATFADCGMLLYNEIVFLNRAGSAPIRAEGTFGPSRKVVRTHQRVLVFARTPPKRWHGSRPVDLASLNQLGMFA